MGLNTIFFTKKLMNTDTSKGVIFYFNYMAVKNKIRPF